MNKDQRSAPDTKAIQTFVDVVYDPDDIVELRAIYKTPKVKRAATSRCIARNLATDKSVLSWIENFNNAGFGIYAVASAMRRPKNASKAGSDKDWIGSHVLYVDWDDIYPEDVEPRIEYAGLPQPTMVIASGRDVGMHAYWRFDELIDDPDEFRALQKTLIEKLNSDKAIHNPSRVMRLPGTRNVKYDGEPECRIISTGARFASWHRLGIEMKIQPTVEIDESKMVDTDRFGWENLHTNTKRFLEQGAHEGNRASELFRAACDMAGNRIGFDEAHNALYEAGSGCGLSGSEILGHVKSAYSQSRTPRLVPVSDIDDVDPLEVSLRCALIPPPPLAVHYGMALESGNDLRQGRLCDTINNYEKEEVLDQSSGNMIEHFFYRSPIEIAETMFEQLDGWPRRAGGMLFYDTGHGIVYIPKHQSLQVFLANQGQASHFLDKGTHAINRKTNTSADLIDMMSFYEHLKTDPIGVTAYEQISDLPHHPEMAETYYQECDLPPATGEKLAELLKNLNAKTEEDRALMLAALLTPGWGGPPGTRPVFVFSAEHTGAGKTETAKLFGEIWGGAAQLDYSDSWANMMKSLFSSDEHNARVLLFDNVKGRFGDSALESAITAKKMGGWKSYVGHITRPNTTTIYLTFNMPEMTHDLAERSVTIHMGEPDYGFDFISWARKFVAEHRLQIVADLIDLLKGPDQCKIPVGQADRWRAWQRGVLTKVPGGSKAITLSSARKQDIDSDRARGLEYLIAFGAYLEATDRGISISETLKTEFSIDELRVVLERRGLIVLPEDRTPGKQQAAMRAVLRGFNAVDPHIVSRVIGKNGRGLIRRVDRDGRTTPSRVDTRRAAIYSWDWKFAKQAADANDSEFDLGGEPPSFLKARVGEIPF